MNAARLSLVGASALAAMFASQTAVAQDASGAGGSGGEAAGDPADFNRALRTVEEDVHALKEQVFRSKATLQLLQEIVVQGSASGARSTIWHEKQSERSTQENQGSAHTPRSYQSAAHCMRWPRVA